MGDFLLLVLLGAIIVFCRFLAKDADRSKGVEPEGRFQFCGECGAPFLPEQGCPNCGGLI